MTDTTPADTTTPSRTGATLLAALAGVGCALVYASGLVPEQISGLMAIGGGVAALLAYFLLRRRVHEAADLPDDRLDEREVADRDRSYFIAYRLVGGAIAVSVMLAIVEDAFAPDLVAWLNPMAALLILAVLLPSAVLATQHDNGRRAV